MYSNPGQDWRSLAEHYRAMSEEELLELAADFADLTETAQQVLSGELRSRGLDRPVSGDGAGGVDSLGAKQLSSVSPPPDAVDEDGEPSHAYTWKTQLCACADDETAWQICEVLKRAGIESWIEGQGRYSAYRELDRTSPRVLVAADELDQARAIASQPIPQEIIDESKMAEPDYETPRCPSCGAEDPILEEVDPVNSWRCESCGTEWTEAVEKEQGKS